MNCLLLQGHRMEWKNKKMWPTNYLTTVNVLEKVGGNTRGLLVHVRNISN